MLGIWPPGSTLNDESIRPHSKSNDSKYSDMYEEMYKEWIKLLDSRIKILIAGSKEAPLHESGLASAIGNYMNLVWKLEDRIKGKNTVKDEPDTLLERDQNASDYSTTINQFRKNLQAELVDNKRC